MTSYGALFTFLAVCALLTSFPAATSKRQLLQVASKTSQFSPSLSQGTDCSLPPNAAWAWAKLDDAPPFQMAIRGGNDVLSAQISSRGVWGELKNASTYGPPGTALDIGANIGYYTFALAMAGWKVYSFEPMAENLALIKATLCANPRIQANVHLFEFGLSSQDKNCTMVVNPANRGNGVVQCTGDYPLDGLEAVGSFQLRRLEDILAEQSVASIDFVKLDVEGYECEVFNGAPSFFSHYHPRLLKTEVWTVVNGCSAVEYMSIFQSRGYKVARWEDVDCKQPLELPLEEPEMIASGVYDFYICS